MRSIHPFYAIPKFGNRFGECVHHRKDVTYKETGVCRQYYSLNNPLIFHCAVALCEWIPGEMHAVGEHISLGPEKPNGYCVFEHDPASYKIQRKVTEKNNN